MTGFIDNAMDFCKGFESVLPVGKVSKLIASKVVGVYVDGWFKSPYSDSSLVQFKDMRVSIDRNTYADINGQRIVEID